jgi:DNA-binding CsgD family transcriptional regulator
MVVTVQQIRVSDREPAEDTSLKEPSLDFRFTVQRILRLCSAIARHYPSDRVTVIIQSSDCREDAGAEKTASEAYPGKDDELGSLLGCLGGDGSGADHRYEAIEPVWPDEYHQEKQPLTKREKETLDLIACGKTNKNIAYIFGISQQTVKCHVGSILRKLHASDRAHSVALALRNGFI